MIIGCLSLPESYGVYSEIILKGLTYLKSLSPDIPVGTYIIDDKMYANVMEYHTICESNVGFEAHRKHLDIHYVLRGEEKIKWSPITGLAERSPYDSEKDAVFYNEPLHGISEFEIKNDRFAIMFPRDGHLCQLALSEPVYVKK